VHGYQPVRAAHTGGPQRRRPQPSSTDTLFYVGNRRPYNSLWAKAVDRALCSIVTLPAPGGDLMIRGEAVIESRIYNRR
jgi:hypothetical protein